MAVAGARVSHDVWSVRLRVPASRGAQLLAASGFALAQPLFDLLGKNAEFFAVRGSTPGDILLFALAVTFVPALVLLVVEVVVAVVNEPAAYTLHLAFVGFLGAVFGVQVLKRAGVDGTNVLIGGAVAIGLGLALAVWKLPSARSFLTVLSVAPIVFLALFLLDSPTSKLVISSGTAEAAAIRTRATTPIVFLLLDEFPVIDLQQADGGIDAKRFPNFARLAGSSTWYRNTTTVSASTTVAVPAILSGQKPKRGALPIFRDHPNNLFTLLGNRYRMVVHESQTRLCPQRLCKQKMADTGSRLSSLYSDVRVVYLHLLAPPALEQRLPVIDESWGNFGSGATEEADPAATDSKGLPKVDLDTFYLGRVRDFRRFVASFRKPGNGPPTLYFLHDLLPHTPWLYFPDGRARAVSSTNAPGRNGERWFNGQLATQAWQRHLLQVGYTDRLLGTFIARLHKVGLWDKALVIVTPDHGISFRGGDLRRRPTHENLAELGFTPLFVKYPEPVGGPGGRLAARDDAGHPSDDRRRARDHDPVAHGGHVGAEGRRRLERGRRGRRAGVLPRCARAAPGLAGTRAVVVRQRRLGRTVLGNRPLPRACRRQRLDACGRVGPAGSAHVDAIGSRLVRSFPRGSALVPSPLQGTLSGVPVGQAVAVAVNGRIAAVSVAYRNPGGGPVRFSALAGEHAFRAGRNAVRVFVVAGRPAHPTLDAVTTALSS